VTRSVTMTSVLLGAVVTLAAAFAIFGGPRILTFWPIESAGDFAQRIVPLFIVALFIERALEVIVTAWRAQEENVRKAMRDTSLGAISPEEKATLVKYKCETQRLALLAGITLGVVVSAVGIRALALFIYPDQIEALIGWQRPLFTSVDVLVTGALIGGGADGLHKLVKVFTTFFDVSVARFEAQRPAAPQR
jgi:hypothetical protein